VVEIHAEWHHVANVVSCTKSSRRLMIVRIVLMTMLVPIRQLYNHGPSLRYHIVPGAKCTTSMKAVHGDIQMVTRHGSETFHWGFGRDWLVHSP
jgi:hypothetical protein